ncbi:hypothetical protein Selin_1161 [Desulfurispirillum indicum S5]|uniref:Integral membrane protein TIGR01906 n=1 Tax=Desulfurispirillum indicum (strain ATCC BAA-1389 / DSM 22839 / S5) TaxID=653733 RepID=E6W4C2_DESIS|nr:DUF1461 domain-containing protein [Desulfurispirillum indicum]ADU65896.1 hypothetical protein Selin_1161 [Desulfurispirillum indicum S5]
MANKQKLRPLHPSALSLPFLFLLSSLYIGWILLGSVNFLYPQWYSLLHIEAHIQEYAPQNIHGKGNFAHTATAEHFRLFQQIVHGIHGRSDLATITYHAPDGRKLGTLLSADEVTHLQDVAHIVTLLTRVGATCLILTLLLALLLWHRRSRLLHPLRATALLGITALCISLGVYILGPVRVFYQLHDWFFPPDNPWFFYYQESLMTTLMKAPDIFGAIAVSWLLLSVFIAATAYSGLWYMLGRR